MKNGLTLLLSNNNWKIVLLPQPSNQKWKTVLLPCRTEKQSYFLTTESELKNNSLTPLPSNKIWKIVSVIQSELKTVLLPYHWIRIEKQQPYSPALQQTLKNSLSHSIRTENSLTSLPLNQLKNNSLTPLPSNKHWKIVSVIESELKNSLTSLHSNHIW